MKPTFSDDKTHFVGVLLPPSLESKVQEKRMWARTRYGCKSGHSTRPHVTLVPPFSSFSSTKVIVDMVRGIASLEKSFSSSVEGYGSFGERTLFLRLPQSDSWTLLSRHISKGLRAMGENVRIENKPFVPHVSVANRDIPKGKIGEMLSLLSQENISESFFVERIGIFHREGWKWVLDDEDVITLCR